MQSRNKKKKRHVFTPLSKNCKDLQNFHLIKVVPDTYQAFIFSQMKRDIPKKQWQKCVDFFFLIVQTMKKKTRQLLKMT